jgi:IS605 OrfB family transposase
MRYATFRFALDPTPAQRQALARHAGASRFAYNECLRMVTDALQARKANQPPDVPWSGFDLIKAFNVWKKSEAAGRLFVTAPDGTTTIVVTGLSWRDEVSAQVFEEAAVDLGRALAAFGRSKSDTDGERRVGFPKRKRKGRCRDSFLHEVSSHLVKTHSQLAIEDLAVANLMANRHLARAIGDAGWAELARQLTYKAAWFGADLMICDRWFASTKTCSACGALKQRIRLAERTFRCDLCGLVCDRDRNAAANLAAWAERHQAQAPDRQAGSRVTNAPGGEGACRRRGDGEIRPDERGTDTRAVVA